MQSAIELSTENDTNRLPILGYGSSSDAVRVLQWLLFCQHYYSDRIDGIFALGTEEAVKSFQKDQGLTVDGIVGPKTWLALSKIYL